MTTKPMTRTTLAQQLLTDDVIEHILWSVRVTDRDDKRQVFREHVLHHLEPALLDALLPSGASPAPHDAEPIRIGGRVGGCSCAETVVEDCPTHGSVGASPAEEERLTEVAPGIFVAPRSTSIFAPSGTFADKRSTFAESPAPALTLTLAQAEQIDDEALWDAVSAGAEYLSKNSYSLPAWAQCVRGVLLQRLREGASPPAREEEHPCA